MSQTSRRQLFGQSTLDFQPLPQATQSLQMQPLQSIPLSQPSVNTPLQTAQPYAPPSFGDAVDMQSLERLNRLGRTLESSSARSHPLPETPRDAFQQVQDIQSNVSSLKSVTERLKTKVQRLQTQLDILKGKTELSTPIKKREMHLLTLSRYIRSSTRELSTGDLQHDAHSVVPGEVKVYCRVARRYATNTLLTRDRKAIRLAYKTVMAQEKVVLDVDLQQRLNDVWRNSFRTTAPLQPATVQWLSRNWRLLWSVDDGVRPFGNWLDVLVIPKGLFPLITTPIATPIAAPITAPITAPIAAPITAPIAAPIAAPITAPIAAPITAPITTPIATPIATPIITTITTPIAAPIAAPSTAITTPIARFATHRMAQIHYQEMDNDLFF